jgi:ferredoxin, 2Fe-2S
VPLVLVIDRDGARHELDAPADAPLMETLRDMDEGVAAICGGMCSCGTCHVYVDAEWLRKLPAPMADEGALLGDLLSRRDNSRLSCQIMINDALSGIKVTIAPQE